MPAKDDFESLVFPGQRLCLDLDWCEKTLARWGWRWKSRGIRAVGVWEYGNVMVCDGVGFWQDANLLTFSLQQVVSKILKQRPPLYVDNLPGESWFTLVGSIKCWADAGVVIIHYYCLLFFDLIFFSFVDSLLAMYLWESEVFRCLLLGRGSGVSQPNWAYEHHL